MTIRDFLDASYALMAEEHQRINPLSSLLDVAERIRPQQDEKPRPERKKEIAARNQESMNILTAALSGARGGPLMGSRSE